MSKMLRESVSVDASVEIAEHLCWNSGKGSKFFVSIIREGLSKSAVNEFQPYFRVLSAILALKVGKIK